MYLTPLQPDEHSKEQVARNNYGGAWKSRLEGGSLDCYLELEIPHSDLKLERCKVEGREVYLYRGDLELAGLNWEGGRNSEWSYSEVLGAVVVGGLVAGGLALLARAVYTSYSRRGEEEEERKKSNKTSKAVK